MRGAVKFLVVMALLLVVSGCLEQREMSYVSPEHGIVSADPNFHVTSARINAVPYWEERQRLWGEYTACTVQSKTQGFAYIMLKIPPCAFSSCNPECWVLINGTPARLW